AFLRFAHDARDLPRRAAARRCRQCERPGGPVQAGSLSKEAVARNRFARLHDAATAPPAVAARRAAEQPSPLGSGCGERRLLKKSQDTSSQRTKQRVARETDERIDETHSAVDQLSCASLTRRAVVNPVEHDAQMIQPEQPGKLGAQICRNARYGAI